MTDRLTFVEVPSRRQRLDLGSAVCDGLGRTPKSLPSRFFYDRRGSELFEEITRLPEYYLTRCEDSIFERLGSEIVAAAGQEIALIEFGSGSSTKTRRLIEVTLRRQTELTYVPIDISRGFLQHSVEDLLADFPALTVQALHGEYFDAVHAMPDLGRPRLVLFLGSNIGNFDSDEAVSFLSGIAAALNPDDRVLIGTDLVKDPSIIYQAYNDSAGVTAAFNRHVLERINAELCGEFDVTTFEHSAPYLEDEARIEMRLTSQREQCVQIEGLDMAVDFQEREWIHTEFCQKYTEDSFAALASASGLEVCERWFDDNRWFAVNLLRKRGAS